MTPDRSCISLQSAKQSLPKYGYTIRRHMLQRNFWPNFGSQNAENSKLLCDGVLYLINANYEADIISGDQQRIENRLNDAVNLGTTYPKLKTYYEQRVRTSL